MDRHMPLHDCRHEADMISRRAMIQQVSGLACMGVSINTQRRCSHRDSRQQQHHRDHPRKRATAWRQPGLCGCSIRCVRSAATRMHSISCGGCCRQRLQRLGAVDRHASCAIAPDHLLSTQSGASRQPRSMIDIQRQACPVARLHLSLPHVISCACVPRRSNVKVPKVVVRHFGCHSFQHICCVLHAKVSGRESASADSACELRTSPLPNGIGSNKGCWRTHDSTRTPCECHPECFGAKQCTSRQTARCD